ncbi:hypothetical protein PV328_009558 [Microctonus aethiopoides]|uniref:Serpin domain-containing protein n=1 Tax=Microctonus aethiopoides TaxID=144406 RepID=A0AA39C616_9HYME|nr:hypothetical protein PV328_009558 [Microctonus aethiopoides]
MGKLRGILRLSLLLLIVHVSRSASQCLTGNDNPGRMNPNSNSMLITAKLGFGLDALRKASEIEYQDNLFFSPHSLYEALTLAYLGARGTTEQSLKSALQIPKELSKIDVRQVNAFEKAIKSLQMTNSTPTYEYESANRLWISDQKKIKPCMLDIFSDELKKTDFNTNPGAARDHINNWASEVTKGHIKDLIPTDGITEDTDLVLTNAVYFKGQWRNRFDPKKSKPNIFYGSTNNSFVTFMKQKANFNHIVSEILGAHVLELPYNGSEISMFILLPPAVTAQSVNNADGQNATVNNDGIRQLINRMTNEEGGIQELRDILENGMEQKEVEVSIPRFTIEKILPVTELLSAMGAGEILIPGKADLRGFLENGEENLHLGDAIHRARIELNEEGTTAAAVTALFSFRSSRPIGPVTFNANHPFVYLIYDRVSKAILFNGVYRNGVETTDNKA